MGDELGKWGVAPKELEGKQNVWLATKIRPCDWTWGAEGHELKEAADMLVR